MKVLGFASGSPLSVLAMQRLAREHELMAVVTPASPAPGWRSRLRRWVRGAPPDPFASLGVSRWTLAQAAQARPDAILVASFPARLPREVFASARLGAFNIHMALLPRHRGIDPVFSTYWDDDREAGVSVHWIDGGIDTGPIAAQRARRLPRGLASRELYRLLADDAVDMAADVLTALADGRADRRAQDLAHATQRSARDIARLRVPADWSSERTWHVLAGLGDQRHELLDAPVRHGRARAFRLGDSRPGLIERRRDGIDVHCADGVVDVELAG